MNKDRLGEPGYVKDESTSDRVSGMSVFKKYGGKVNNTPLYTQSINAIKANNPLDSKYDENGLIALSENFKKFVKAEYARKFNLVKRGNKWIIGVYAVPGEPKVLNIPADNYVPGKSMPYRLVWRFRITREDLEEPISLRLSVLGDGTAVVDQVADGRLVKRVERFKLV